VFASSNSSRPLHCFRFDWPKPLETGDRDRLLEALPNDTLAQKRDRALILLLLSTGARISEILRLDRNDWKPERLWVLGKGDRERVVQVTEKTRAAVENYLTARGDHSPRPVHRLPASEQGRPLQSPHHRWRPACAANSRAGSTSPRSPPPAPAHARDPARNETIGDARLTAETLGHRGLGSVSGYTKITDQRRREAYDEMQRRIRHTDWLSRGADDWSPDQRRSSTGGLRPSR
jgi:integrase/recombinase XerD